MNLGRLRAIHQELGVILADADLSKDDLAVHIYHARKSYHREVAIGRKDIKRLQHEAERSYRSATELNYCGSYVEWLNILRPGA